MAPGRFAVLHPMASSIILSEGFYLWHCLIAVPLISGIGTFEAPKARLPTRRYPKVLVAKWALFFLFDIAFIPFIDYRSTYIRTRPLVFDR